MRTTLTTPELHALIEVNADDADRQGVWVGELAWRRVWEIQRAIPARRGICKAGLPFMIDEKGGYASGYPLHARAGYDVCDHGVDTWDEDSPEVKALKAERDNLNHIAKLA